MTHPVGRESAKVAPGVSAGRLDPSGPHHEPLLVRDAAWLASTAALVALLTLLPVVFDRGFYYFDDTAGGAFGQWWELGQQLRSGRWPILSVDGWYAGNYLVEGQWGLYNPAVWLIALASTAATDAAWFSTGVKIVFLVLGGTGVYCLARSHGARPEFALLAGVSAPIAGFTLYLDATAWVTNLEVWAWFPWAWWGLRRHLYGRGSLAVAFAFGFLLVTVGYVQGTLMLVVLHVGLLVEQAASRSWVTMGRSLVVGVTHGLVALTVFLPGVVSSEISVRADTIDNDGFMTLTLNGLAVSAAPQARPDLSGWWGRYGPMPYTYIAWFLPLAALVPGDRLLSLARRSVGALVVLGTVLLLAVGPSQLGPLRFPVRSTPWIALIAILLVCVALSALTEVAQRRPARLAIALGLVGGGHWLAWAAYPDSWKQQLGCAVIIGLVSTAVWWASWQERSPRLRPAAMAWLLVVMTVLTFAVQSRVFASYADDHFGVDGVPASVSALSRPLDAARGDVLVVGNPLSWGPALWQEGSLGNMWYLKPHPTLNLYSPVGFAAFNADVCVQPYYGLSCYQGLDTLFTPDAVTGVLLVDLLSIDTVQVLADPSDEDRSVESLQDRFEVPAGWRLADADELSFTWVREQVTPALGGVVWTTEGLAVEMVDSADESVRLRVTEAPSSGGEIVFSRLAWPGYEASGAEIAEPLRGYLLRVQVPVDAVGSEIVVSFRPPLWAVQVGALVAALALTVAGTVATAVHRRRPRPAVVVADRPRRGRADHGRDLS